MTYPEIRRRMLAVAFVVAAPVVLVSALLYAFGVDVNPGLTDWGSGVEGLVGYVGYVFLTPVWLHLAARAGAHRPVLGAIAAVTALIGVGGAIANMTARVVIASLVDVGVTVETLDAWMEQFSSGEAVMLVLVLMSGTCGPLTSILVGVGMLRSVDRNAGILLIAAGPVFLVGQALSIGAQVFYPLAIAIWCAALVPLGLQMWRESVGAASADPAHAG